MRHPGPVPPIAGRKHGRALVQPYSFYALVYTTSSTPRCPRLQAHSSGGRVYAFLDRANNLPDADRHQQSGLSDPYVKFSVGSMVVRSSVVDESLNPVRN